ncbi:type III restriction endonuclease [Faecalibacterium prausnitzii]|nr:type III restriction endonuclease [Faecalibacterium prausnitzii]
MYVFIKEFMNNAQVYELFDDWRNKRNRFSEASYYSNGQLRLGDALTEKQTDVLFKQMKKYRESYPNYIYALTMGLGKTILMGTCIFYEFLLAKKYPKDKRFCHNALVFAPDKTVLQSLREIMIFDKTKVVPPEYARVLDSNIKFHFLDESGTDLHTIDDSDFNIIISNTQKIIIKKKRKEATPGEVLFGSNSSLLSAVYGGDDSEDDAWDDSTLMDNQRFKKLCRLPQLGVYVDEAHHLFGADLEKQIRSSGANKTSLRDTINLLAANTSIVACYNYTGTPYVKNQLLPEVVYAYGLRESIWNGYLKDADPIGFENVKSDEFLNATVTKFWQKYGGRIYDNLNPKLAIYAANVDEAVNEVVPALEEILTRLEIPTTSILLNVGDSKYTKDEDIRNFNNLDVPGSEGNEKQFVVLVEKGKEGWNCRSLFGVALYRSPKSKIFVLQATMRCLRAITDERLTATVFLSKENYDTLDDELHKNFNMEISDIKNTSTDDRHKYQVRVLPPPRSIRLKRVWHEYTVSSKVYSTPVDFGLVGADLSKYSSVMYERDSIANDTSTKQSNADEYQVKMQYSAFSLAGEVARYLNISSILAAKILREAQDGMDVILADVNRYNAVLDDIIIPTIFHALFDVTAIQKTEDRDVVLLREPKDAAYYEFSAKDDLVITNKYPGFTPDEVLKSFHADTYCFDSLPEKECFFQYIKSDKVQEVYFTGMFTSNQGDLSVYYYDPESGRIRQYYPDFLAKMKDGTYQLIEVKGDNKIDDVVVQAKKEAALEMAAASGIKYEMYAGSTIMKTHILESLPVQQTNLLL